MAKKKAIVGSIALLAVFGVGTSVALDNGAVPFVPTSDQDRIDPESYFEDYEEGASDSSGMNYSTSQAPNAFSSDSGYKSRYDQAPQVPSPGQDNYFIDYGTDGPVTASQDEVSTFALDVDTGSFGVAYESVRAGIGIDPTSVRSEEWINAMDYETRNGTGEDLALATEANESSKDPRSKLVRVNVSGREASAEEKGLNITVVMDTSGSMDIRDRLGLVKSSIALLAKNLDPDDKISLVTFDEDGKVLLEPTAVDDTRKILNAIDEIEPGGGTNLEAGLQEGYRQASKSFAADENNIVLLASDGVANIGNVTADTIEDNGKKGIHLVTVGYGLGNYNDGLMEQLADRGDGFYSYLNTYEETERFFTDEIQKVTEPVAMDAKVQVTFDPEIVETYRLVGYENRALSDEDFDDASVDAGEFGSGHSATAIYEVLLTGSIDGETVLGEAEVRWADVDTGENESASKDIVITGEEATSDYELAALAADAAEYVKWSKLSDDRSYRPVIAERSDLIERAESLTSDYDGAVKILEILQNDSSNFEPQYEY